MVHKGDASNAAVRALLTLVGERHDLAVFGTPPGELRDKKLKQRLAAEFNNQCVYCETHLSGKMEVDHVIPMNQKSLGLHMYGNLVPACTECNRAKKSKSLGEFLEKHKIRNSTQLKNKIEARARRFGVTEPSDALKGLVANLYLDVGSLVVKQAESILKTLPEPSTATKAEAKKIQKKSDYDFSEISKKFPIGSWVNAVKDDLVGEVVDYSLEGPIGKRTPYVKFIVLDTGAKVRRAPSQLNPIKSPYRAK
ncbi:MAG: hypothetical protein F2662_01925 [Actinobacteria bacterium]|uniref:Unannotated protein n=1 Tax=freshwater metagenome TaxID=449393 RepID=A0A6J6NEN5_9ZZZZ|nr:hypothetical protein [Actinomycetota bacterium]